MRYRCGTWPWTIHIILYWAGTYHVGFTFSRIISLPRDLPSHRVSNNSVGKVLYVDQVLSRRNPDMMSLWYFSLLVLLPCRCALADTLTPGCDPSKFVTAPNESLPVIPDQFMIVAEINVVLQNKTIFVKEYLDEIGNRARIDGTDEGQTQVTIANYNDREAVVFPDRNTGEACTVYPITLTSPNRNFLVRRVLGVVPGPNGTVHIGPPSMNFQRINNSNALYIGVEMIRGIPCHYWQACYVTQSEWYLYDVYFTASDQWQLPYMEPLSPVFIRQSGQTIENDTLRDVNYTISYTLFQSGPDAVPDEVFQVPLGLPCKQRRAGPPLPPFPKFFSTNAEVVFGNTVIVVKVRICSEYFLFLFDCLFMYKRDVFIQKVLWKNRF